MWKMTLKQRRRHSELVVRFDQLKNSKYINVPEDYVFGDNPEEDEKYETTINELNDVIQEIHDIEESARAST